MRKVLITLIVITILISLTGQAAANSGAASGGKVYTVTWGDTLQFIAQQHGVSIEAILRQNGLTNPDFIYVGQKLVIPTTGYSHETPASNSCAPYTVQVGDTLSGIAWQNNTTVQALLQANSLYNKDFVYVGQQICIPGASGNNGHAQKPAATTYHYHTVAPGETLSGIALRYGVNYWTIVQANNLSNASYIWVGQQLVIPGGYQPQTAGYENYSYKDDDYAHETMADHDYGDNTMANHDYGTKSEDTADTTSGSAPEAPAYQPQPASTLLPRSEHPITVVVNGGAIWTGEVFDTWDPDGITTLVVKTGDQDGKLVRLQNGDATLAGESGFSGEFGANTFAFRYAPPGEYDVWIDDELGSQKTRVTLEEGARVLVEFGTDIAFRGQTFASPGGWILADWNNPSRPHENIGGWSSVLVQTPASGLWVIIEADGGGYRAKCLTGSKGDGACEFGGLGAGLYNIFIENTDFTVQTWLDGNAHANFAIGRQP